MSPLPAIREKLQAQRAARRSEELLAEREAEAALDARAEQRILERHDAKLAQRLEQQVAIAPSDEMSELPAPTEPMAARRRAQASLRDTEEARAEARREQRRRSPIEEEAEATPPAPNPLRRRAAPPLEDEPGQRVRQPTPQTRPRSPVEPEERPPIGISEAASTVRQRRQQREAEERLAAMHREERRARWRAVPLSAVERPASRRRRREATAATPPKRRPDSPAPRVEQTLIPRARQQRQPEEQTARPTARREQSLTSRRREAADTATEEEQHAVRAKNRRERLAAASTSAAAVPVREKRALTARLEQNSASRAAARAAAAEAAWRERLPDAVSRAAAPAVEASVDAPPEVAPPPGLLRLRTAGAFVVDENGAAIKLRGVTVEGLDSVAPAPAQSLAEALSLDGANLAAMTELWGINLIRIPFSAATILSGNGSLSSAALLAGLDDVIAKLAEVPLYVLLSLTAPPADSNSATAPLPDQSAQDCWGLLAARYLDMPAVLFEIFVSPMPLAAGWFDAAQVLIGTIRMQNPASLVLMGNGSSGTDTTGLPLRFSTGDPVPNVLYTIRADPGHQFSTAEENVLPALTRSFPVIASPWSGDGASEFDRFAELAANIFGRYGIGWSASSWNAQPRLVANAAEHNFAPTRWGYVFQRAMALPARHPLTMLLPGAPAAG